MKLFHLLQKLNNTLGTGLYVYPKLNAITGSGDSTAIICHLISKYALDNFSLENEYLITTEEFLKMTGIASYKRLLKAKKILLERKILETVTDPTSHSVYYRIDFDVLDELIKKHDQKLSRVCMRIRDSININNIDNNKDNIYSSTNSFYIPNGNVEKHRTLVTPEDKKDNTANKKLKRLSTSPESKKVKNSISFYIPNGNIETDGMKDILFSREEYLKEMKSDKNIAIRIIGQYLAIRKIQFNSRAQAQVLIKRHIRAANQLKVFSMSTLKKVARYCVDKYGRNNVDWTLETMIKVVSSQNFED